MRCLEPDALLELAEGRVEASERTSVEAHLDECPVCLEAVGWLVRSGQATEGPEGGVDLGRYQLKRCVGAGGMGAVYAAVDRKLDRWVAIKLLRSSSTDESLSGDWGEEIGRAHV